MRRLGKAPHPLPPPNETQAGVGPMVRPPVKFSLQSGARPLEGYTIKRGVGAGGFGEVYFAKSDGGKDVAIKRIQRNLDVELRGVRQCLNIKHPNLVAIFDIKYDSDGLAWVVMEYVANDSLQAVIERNPNGMPLDAVKRWFEGIASGTAHLHDCGIVHRDLKPANVFLDEATVKIGDYGLSKFISCSRRSGQTQSVGTLHYMAPEIGNGRYGKEIDIYALGIMLYEMLTGVVPFDGESNQEVLIKHLTALPDLDRVPAGFRGAIGKALAKDPKDRFRSVAAMQEAFEKEVPPGAFEVPVIASAAGQPGTTPPATTRQATPRPATTPAAAEPDWAASSSTPSKLPRLLANEPIAEAAVAACSEIVRSWNDPEAGLITKLAILATGVLAAVFSIRWLLPYASVLLFVYVIYLAIRPKRSNAMRRTDRRTSQKATKMAVDALSRERRRIVTRRYAVALPMHIRRRISQKDKLTRVTELLGSWLKAAAMAALFSLVAAHIVAANSGSTNWIPNFVWLSISGTVAAWAILAPGKLWETGTGDALSRRLALAILGAVVGCISFSLADALEFRPTYLLPDMQVLDAEEMSPNLFAPDGMPRMAGFALYYAILFGALRWWRLTDPTRKRRICLSTIVGGVLGATFLQTVCPMPEAVLVVAGASVAIQVASPWVSEETRDQMREELIAQELRKFDAENPQIVA